MNSYFEKLQPYLEKAMALTTAKSLFDWDDQTLAPYEAGEYTGKVIGILSDEYMKSLINDDVREILQKLQSEKVQNDLTDTERSIIKALRRTYEQLENIPPDEYRAYNELAPMSNRKWAQAKKDNNFALFAPYLEKIIEYKKKFAGYRAKKDQSPYDVLLADYEECFNIKELDVFFDKIKEEIIPLLQTVAEKTKDINRDYNFLSYDIQKQKEFCRYVAEYIGFDFNRGVIAESAHPFSLGLHNHDVRITSHYQENNLESAIFSMIHEAGHGIYEMNVDDSITQTLVGGGASMGMHESQSRLYENIIGRSKAFWEPIYQKLVDFYPDNLKDISIDQFIYGINKAQPSLIRTEADELSYTIHIIIRYEIEKMIFTEDIDINQLPTIWNEKYTEYMGITPEKDSEGILQDTHWSWGEFGYFPSYAIGSAVAAQLYAKMKEVMPIEQYLRDGQLSQIKDYLRDAVHKYGATKNTQEILSDVTGQELNADYYIEYLKNKYQQIYQL